MCLIMGSRDHMLLLMSIVFGLADLIPETNTTTQKASAAKLLKIMNDKCHES